MKNRFAPLCASDLNSSAKFRHLNRIPPTLAAQQRIGSWLTVIEFVFVQHARRDFSMRATECPLPFLQVEACTWTHTGTLGECLKSPTDLWEAGSQHA